MRNPSGRIQGEVIVNVSKLVNNAGYVHYTTTLSTPHEEFEKMIRTNLMAPWFLVQATVPHMPRGGRIINISSCLSKMGWDFTAGYTATKAAVDSLTFTWAQEVKIEPWAIVVEKLC